jgi:hypothetical protein
MTKIMYCRNCRQKVCAKSRSGYGCTSWIMLICTVMTLAVFGISSVSVIMAFVFAVLMLVFFIVHLASKTVWVCPICKGEDVYDASADVKSTD